MDMAEFFEKTLEEGKAELPQLVKSLQAMIDADLAHGTDSITPQMLVTGFNTKTGVMQRTMIMLMVDFNEHDEKHRAMRGVAMKLHSQSVQPLAVAFASECWMSAEAGPGGKYTEPRLDPNRSEGVIVFGDVIDQSRNCVCRLRAERREGKLFPAGEWEAQTGEIELPLLKSFWKGYLDSLGKKLGRE